MLAQAVLLLLALPLLTNLVTPVRLIFIVAVRLVDLHGGLVVGLFRSILDLVVDLLQHTQRLLTSCRRKLHAEPRNRSLLRDEARLRRQRRLLREALLLLVSAQADVATPHVADLDSRRAG